MANINRNFGKLIDGELTYAPRSLIIDGREIWNPRAETYAAAGYLPVMEAAPSEPPREGYHWTPDGWEARDGVIRRVWREEANPPPPPRTFSKYKLVGALMQAEVWPQVKAWIESIPGAYDLYLAAEDISEDEPLLAQGIAAVKELLGWTDAQVEAILAASVMGG